MNALDPTTKAAILVASALAALALVATLALRSLARRRVGRVLWAESPRDLARAARWIPIAATLAILAVQWSAGPHHQTVVLVGLLLFLAATTPGTQAQMCGDQGVLRGWHARSFSELEEWRLTGEHLRWKLYGEWQACRVPPQLHADLRERLTQACPDRESSFA